MAIGTPLPTSASRSPIAQIELGLQALTAYAVPAFIALLSIWAMLSWPTEYPNGSGRHLAFQAFTFEDGRTPEQALLTLQLQPPITAWDTRLSEQPLWVLVTLPQPRLAEALEFPSRHAKALRCWDGDGLRAIGYADRRTGYALEAPLRLSRAGFALTSSPLPTRVLCEVRLSGPARFVVVLRSASELNQLEHAFHRDAGWLDGGMLLLALFALIVGIINRDRNHLIFATWLVINQRMAALSGGWDYQWIGYLIPPEYLTDLRQLTIAIYATVTVVLFRFLFEAELQRAQMLTWVRAVMLACVPVLVAAFVLPYRIFLPIVWGATAIGVCVLGYTLARILLRTRSTVAMWYAAAMATALGASLYEVVAAALGLKAWIGAFDSVTAAIASSLLASLAIAERFRQEHVQRLALQAELQHTFEFLPIGLFTLDHQGRFLSANPALTQILGHTIEAGQDAWERWFRPYDWTKLWTTDAREHIVEFETVLIQEEGVGRRFQVRAARAGEKIEGTLQDITDKVRAFEHLQFLADHDPLTKVLNRRGIEACLSRGQQRLRRGNPLAVAYLDLDRFKLVNDLYGHPAGDSVLQKVCERARAPLPANMYLGRIGGDEFLLVMLDTPLQLALATCRDILARLAAEPYQIGERAFQVRGSIGLIEVDPNMSTKDVIATADRACREAKQSHATQLVVYEHGCRALRDHEAEMQLVARLTTGQDIDGLFLEMQPIVALRHPHQSHNFEVLLRMHDEHGSRVPTERLIRAGEAAGRMSAIDRWVVQSTLRWLAQHDAALPQNQFVCLNLSGASLNDERFIADMYDMLDQYRHVVRRLCLEITESVALHDMGNTRRFIDRVRSHGARVALDDFGAGYTSFSYLKDLPADILKVDGSFIVNMNRHPANVAIVEAIVSLAQSLGMKTIAEWAEDFETVETLAEIGVDYVQGYAISRPVSAERILASSSGADFISDPRLSDYLNTLPPDDDELAHVDWVLGHSETDTPGAPQPSVRSISG
jgi:diguanylate cyclase (GGDEF)-like protein